VPDPISESPTNEVEALPPVEAPPSVEPAAAGDASTEIPSAQLDSAVQPPDPIDTDPIVASPDAAPVALADEPEIYQSEELQLTENPAEVTAGPEPQFIPPVKVDEQPAPAEDLLEIQAPDIAPSPQNPAEVQSVAEDVPSADHEKSQASNASGDLYPNGRPMSILFSEGSSSLDGSFPMFPQASPQVGEVPLPPSAHLPEADVTEFPPRPITIEHVNGHAKFDNGDIRRVQ
jgi:hypothetical protein